MNIFRLSIFAATVLIWLGAVNLTWTLVRNDWIALTGLAAIEGTFLLWLHALIDQYLISQRSK